MARKKKTKDCGFAELIHIVGSIKPSLAIWMMENPDEINESGSIWSVVLWSCSPQGRDAWASVAHNEKYKNWEKTRMVRVRRHKNIKKYAYTIAEKSYWFDGLVKAVGKFRPSAARALMEESNEILGMDFASAFCRSLSGLFVWADSPQGHDYWEKICDNLSMYYK